MTNINDLQQYDANIRASHQSLHTKYGNKNNSLPNYGEFAKELSDSIPVFEETLGTREVNNIESKNVLNKYIPKSIKDPIIIFILYFLLSLPVVQKNISKIIPYTVPNSSGQISMI